VLNFEELQMLAHVLHWSLALVVLPDGRRAQIFKNEGAIAEYIQSRVTQLATAAIASKGAFSLSIGSGTTVKPLVQLGSSGIDWTRVHVFFGNERTEGDAAGKCFSGAAEFVEACGVPAENVHRVPSLAAEEAAQAYEATVRGAPSHVVGTCARSGLPALDLVLLGSGADGHCASLYPKSSQVLCSPGSERMYLPAEGKGGITLSVDAISSARHVLLSAGKPAQADMVRKCLGWSNAATNTALPAGMITARPGTEVEWLLTERSAVELPAL
jgi:6-phosphogluconolactonase